MRGHYYKDTIDARPTQTVNTVKSAADARAIVAYVAHAHLQTALPIYRADADLIKRFPALEGLTREQITAAISEALA